MEKTRINILLNHPTEATFGDIFLLEEEIRKYPYASYLHTLLAKVNFQLDADAKNQKLTSAAIYSTDRSVLKKIIQQSGYLESIKNVAPYQHEIPDGISVQEEEAPVESQIPSGIIAEEAPQEEAQHSSTIFAEVLKNLEKLKALRKQFQFLELNEPEPVTTVTDQKVEKKALEEKIPQKEKKQSIEKIQDQKSEETEPKKSVDKKKKRDELWQQDELLDSEVNVYFLREIEQKTETIERLPSDRHLVQNEIIERFIVEQPSIGSVKRESEKSIEQSNRDLAEKSTRFNEDLISENLAIILLKQGKKERAIDIYKKLIWKLPQKKAYFAARIEEINK